jgi:hypothetical protein
VSLEVLCNNDFQGETQSNVGGKKMHQFHLSNRISTCTGTEFESPNFQLLGILIENKDYGRNSRE